MYSPGFFQFIEDHIQADPATLALRQKSGAEFDVKWALEQIHCLQKAKYKLPTWYKERCLFTRRALEQATAEEVARYKAGLFTGEVLVDLSGGLGVDDWAFSSAFKQVLSVDSDEELNKLVRYNWTRLGITNCQRITGKAEKFIDQIPLDSTVYLDPDRRDGTSRKFLLEECSPNVLELVPVLQEKGCKVYIKISPLFEATELERKLSGVSRILAIAYHNEMKELLVEIVPESEAKVQRIAVNLSDGKIQQFQGRGGAGIGESNGEETWFFEPNVALIKLRLWKEYAGELGLSYIHPETPFLVGNEPVENFQGRQFKVIARMEGNLKQVGRYLAENGIKKANLSERNAGAGVEELKKQLKLKDGGEAYLFFMKTTAGKMLCIHGRRNE
ncbi:MAG: class I SAM-dependent methyltransferase [Bacteroidia bacterium]|nr:class I SAM-dependent methyltransferase [Bacteroidia bacterium]